MSKKSRKCFNPGIGPGPKQLCNRKLLGERVLRPSLDEYRLFVQSTGSGVRHLAQGSILLYESLVPQPLLHVDEEQFILCQVLSDSTLKDWCQRRLLEFSEHSVFLELQYIEKDKEIHDVILKDKDTKQLLTGPRAHQMVEKHIDGTQEIDMEQWVVFVLTRCEETFELKENMWVLYHKLTEEERLSEEVPLIHIKSGQYVSKKLHRDYQLKQFCEEYCLDCHVPNVFVKIGRVDLSKPDAKVLDVMLMNKKSGDLYTGPIAWNETQKYRSGAKDQANRSPWRVLVLSNLDGNSQLPKHSWVLYRVNNSPRKANGLVHIHSNHFVSARMKHGDKLSDICNLQGIVRKECDVFLEPGSFRQTVAAGCDVILMDKATEELFTGPFARQLVTQFEVGGKSQEESRNRWKVFTHNESNKDFVCTNDTLVWHKNHKQLSQRFHVVKVDVDNVRMSNFVTEKLNLDFDNGKAFYEFNQPEDLLYHKEVVIMPVNGESEVPVNGELECSFRSFYEISGAPGMDIQPISFEDSSKVFIQSLSQGSRCLKRGSIILYKKDEAQQTNSNNPNSQLVRQ